MTERWSELSRALADLGPAAVPPLGARVGAALALLSDPGDGDLAVVLTRRRDDLRHHPGQVSFPGGRVDPGESLEDAALREAAEECALDPSTVDVLGVLPAFYIPPSRFWMQVVVGGWRAPHPLRAAEGEVAEILRLRLSVLRDERRWRVVRRLHRVDTWAWQIDDRHLLWGATGAAVAALLDLLEPGWNGGLTPVDLPDERAVRPWARPGTAVPRPGPARLVGAREVPITVASAGPPAAAGEATAAVDAAALAADAVTRLLGRARPGRVLVLAGRGRTGALGLETAARLHRQGVDVRVVLAAGEAHPAGRTARDALGERVEAFGGALPRADLVVDALVGRGLRGPLRSPALDVVMALRSHTAPVLSLDLPSGVHADAGLVGDLVAADVTLSLGTLPAGLLVDGLGPYVGDLYVAGSTAADPREGIVRVVPTPEQRASA